MSLKPAISRRKRKPFDWSTAVMAVVVGAAAGIVYWRDGRERFLDILGSDFGLFAEMLPKVLAGCFIGAFVALLLPRELVARWVGKDPGCSGCSLLPLSAPFFPAGR